MKFVKLSISLTASMILFQNCSDAKLLALGKGPTEEEVVVVNPLPPSPSDIKLVVAADHKTASSHAIELLDPRSMTLQQIYNLTKPYNIYSNDLKFKSLGDLDGDTWNDFMIVKSSTNGAMPEQSFVQIVSSKNAELLTEIIGQTNKDIEQAMVISDINSDGHKELVTIAGDKFEFYTLNETTDNFQVISPSCPINDDIDFALFDINSDTHKDLVYLCVHYDTTTNPWTAIHSLQAVDIRPGIEQANRLLLRQEVYRFDGSVGNTQLEIITKDNTLFLAALNSVRTGSQTRANLLRVFKINNFQKVSPATLYSANVSTFLAYETLADEHIAMFHLDFINNTNTPDLYLRIDNLVTLNRQILMTSSLAPVFDIFTLDILRDQISNFNPAHLLNARSSIIPDISGDGKKEFVYSQFGYGNGTPSYKVITHSGISTEIQVIDVTKMYHFRLGLQ